MIFVNKPYLIEVNESGQIGSKIELFVWNGATAPSTPTYTFTKDAPSTTDLANYYNISPFIAEYIQFGINDTSTFTLLNDSYYANVRVKRYKNVAGTYTLLDSTDYKAMYGNFGEVNYGGLLPQDTYYTLGSCSVDGCDTISVTYKLIGEDAVTVEVGISTFEPIVNGKNRYDFNVVEGVNGALTWNPDLGVGASWYYSDGDNIAYLTQDTPCPFGVFTIEEGSIFESFEVQPSGTFYKHLFPLLTNTTNKTIRWTDLYNGATTTETLTANKLYVINGARFETGTKVEFLNNFGGVVNTWTFLPQCECVYDPVKVQFLNTYGALFTTWFFKASKNEFSIENSEFKKFQTVESNFYVGKQRQTFNTLGREKISVNSGWVNESYSQVIKDILMSEYTLVNDNYANVDTKSIEIQKNINNGLINYQLSFTYSNDYRR